MADPDLLADHLAVRRMAESRRNGWLGLESLCFVAEATYERLTGDHEAFHAAIRDPRMTSLSDSCCGGVLGR
jgi:hypothetical protein